MSVPPHPPLPPCTGHLYIYVIDLQKGTYIFQWERTLTQLLRWILLGDIEKASIRFYISPHNFKVGAFEFAFRVLCTAILVILLYLGNMFAWFSQIYLKNLIRLKSKLQTIQVKQNKWIMKFCPGDTHIKILLMIILKTLNYRIWWSYKIFMINQKFISECIITSQMCIIVWEIYGETNDL